MSDVRRVIIHSNGVDPMGMMWFDGIEHPTGNDALMPWSQHIEREREMSNCITNGLQLKAEIERLRKVVDAVRDALSIETQRAVVAALRELEDSDE